VPYLLDTNCCVNYLRGGENSGLGGRFALIPESEIRLCSIVVGELLYGALRSKKKEETLQSVREFCSRFASHAFDDPAAEQYAALRAHLAAAGTPIGPNDLMIAAVALAGGLTLVTHNTREFSRVPGLRLEDWQSA
jgi:tRNA(fMet)-specific endonuclease VapC